jgi:hypothetical protein
MRRWPHPSFGVDFLTYLPDGLVHYQGTRIHPRLGTDHQLLSAVDFLALLASHVLLRYQVTKRCYGAVSTTFQKRAGWIEALPVNEPPIAALTPVAPSLPPPQLGQTHSQSFPLRPGELSHLRPAHEDRRSHRLPRPRRGDREDPASPQSLGSPGEPIDTQGGVEDYAVDPPWVDDL